MPSSIRTLGPLHLEDLEPHRFEDLVRQLLYDFRSWRQLEATGRAGSDDGFDARGWEIVSGEPHVADEIDEGEGFTPGDNEPSRDNDRLWLIQCKRERAIGPTKLTRYLDQISADERSQLYGLVLAAACDFSKQGRDRFREKARQNGLSEAHLWGKGEIEDMLFQPKNDHLLFAYFGISLQVRRRALKTEIRARLATKRKALHVLKPHMPVLIRDASDERYPRLDEDTSKDRFDRGRWKVMTFERCQHDGLRFHARRHLAFIDDKGKRWDFAEKSNEARPHPNFDPWADQTEQERRIAKQEAHEIWNGLPEKNRAWFEVFYVMPYENILGIDEQGDEVFKRPHICTPPQTPTLGPFRPYSYISLRTIGDEPRTAEADEEKRVVKFPRPVK